MSDSLRIIFAGTPDFAATHLEALLNSTHHVVGVFTQPDRPAGRGKKLTPSPVKQLAEQQQVAVFQPVTLRSEQAQQSIADLKADIMVVVAYGLLLPSTILTIPRLGCINVHGSLLPRWRGAAPIQRALWAGDTETGITIMQMDTGLDTGDMLHKLTCPILPSDTSASLYTRLAELGPHALLETLDALSSGRCVAKPQDDNVANYATKLSKEEAKLDWSLSAVQLERAIRAFNPWPISYFMVGDNVIKVWQASVLPHRAARAGEILASDKSGIQVATADGVLNIEALQPAGKKVMKAQDLLNSRREWFTPGTQLL